ncbi:hypothetical protein RUM43_006614 [Polyplax serrata]|uniref:Uncharacterized protein n=1 Tax=Polyplax serrata TaxID=468196 RepID=A0AAN8S2A7_POLSC
MAVPGAGHVMSWNWRASAAVAVAATVSLPCEPPSMFSAASRNTELSNKARHQKKGRPTGPAQRAQEVAQ